MITLDSEYGSHSLPGTTLIKRIGIWKGVGKSVKIHCLWNYGTMGGVVEIINYTSGLKEYTKINQL